MSEQVEVGVGEGALWSTRYPVTITGVEGDVEVRHGFAGGLTVYLDGARAERGTRRGQFFVPRSDGSPLEVTVRAASMATAPIMVVDEHTTPIGRRVVGLEWLWVGIPLLMPIYSLFVNGSFGGVAVGGLAFYGNVRIFIDDGYSVRERYRASLLSMAIFTGIFVALAVAVVVLFQ